MTCIVGVQGRGGAYIGADSFSGNEGLYTRHGGHKIFEVGGVLFGCVSSFRMMDILRYEFEVPALYPMEEDPPESDYWVRPDGLNKWVRATFSEAVREAMGEGGFKKTSDGQESAGFFLFAVRGWLFQMQDDFSVFSVTDYSALGCATEAALGSLHSTLGMMNFGPRVRCAKALEAAKAHVPLVADPMTILMQSKVGVDVPLAPRSVNSLSPDDALLRDEAWRSGDRVPLMRRPEGE